MYIYGINLIMEHMRNYIQLSLFPETFKDTFLVAPGSPKKAFYHIWIENYRDVYFVKKESGNQNKTLDTREWVFREYDTAVKYFEKKVRDKINPQRISPRKYTIKYETYYKG